MQATKGFFTFAQNTENVDYVRLAYGLALSLKFSQSNITQLSIGVTPGTKIDERYKWAFDNVIEIPWGDAANISDWKLENEWKAIWMSPYDETIKLDADMLFFSDITSWWEYFENRDNDLLFTNRVMNWRGEEVSNNYYRKVFVENSLPNLYSAFFYFRKTEIAYDFFNLSKIIFWNWEKFFEEYLHYNYRPTFLSTDVIFSLAAKILNEDSYTPSLVPTFTHMKSKIQGWGENVSEDWRENIKTFFTPTGVCKIGNHRQFYPLHYYVKEFLTDEIIQTYEKLLNG